ncbi:CAF17-like 4Fe-4S cluster assembly/insertion protein YgfZ [Alteromonas halophila]|uniref:tRNA-modifying protein YgfZ n=1 Tax=Alteromonas halophila TaxID=516698 RepID=A0A918JLT1_9ALTE|nr:glycine cleavage system protein T [Alteromonas halophila]GGW86039.1 tRNA-modifying protein YgfZ [Alteromonas halophila]
MTSLTSLSALPDDFVMQPDNIGCIKVTGEDRDSYLHGQLTVNINALTSDQARFAAHCDNKGKVWAVLEVVRHEDGVLLYGNRDAVDASFAQLQKYGVFSKVEMTEQHTAYRHIVISQNVGRAAAKTLFSDVPDASMAALSNDYGVVIQTRLEGSPLHFIVTAEGEAQLNKYLSENHDDIASFGAPEYEALCVVSGIPAVSGDMIGQYIPQMLNVQAIDGIDFDKGCYMGQEVVARTRFLGRNKRAAFSFSLPVPTSMNAGDTVEKQLGENWRRGGNVVRYATLADESYFMAVLANDTGSDDAHRLAELPAHEVTPLALPYSIAQENRDKPGRTGA